MNAAAPLQPFRRLWNHAWALAVRRWTRRIAGYLPVTPLGLTLLVILAASFLFVGVIHRDIVILIGAFCSAILAVILAALTITATLLASRALRKAATAPIHELEAGHSMETGFAIRFSRWFPIIDVAWKWESEIGQPDGFDLTIERSGPLLQEFVAARRRGVFASIRRRFTVADVLGLTRISWSKTEAANLTVWPSRLTLQDPLRLEGLASGDDTSDPLGEPVGDPVEMRQYVPGDSPRTILWKVYARTRKLMVRIPERAVLVHPRGCAYMLAGPNDEASASVARTVLERGMLGEGWAFGADGTSEIAATLDSALAILARSGNESYRPGRSSHQLGSFLRQMESKGYAHCAVFLPSSGGPWIEELPQAMAGTQLRMQLIVGLEHFSPDERPAVWKRLVFRPDQSGRPDTRALAQLARDMEGIAEKLYLVDRATGLVYAGITGTEGR
jgi:hypothetical protein